MLCCSLDSILGELEKNAVAYRWKPGDVEYEAMRTYCLNKKMEQIRTAMWSSVVKRQYLLQMKAKYAGQLILS